MCKCKLSGEELSTMICVEDFNGFLEPGHFPISYWADYDKTKNVVHFGGDWNDVPDMKSKTLPSHEEIIQHVVSYNVKNNKPITFLNL